MYEKVGCKKKKKNDFKITDIFFCFEVKFVFSFSWNLECNFQQRIHLIQIS